MNKTNHRLQSQPKAKYAAPALEKGFKVIGVLANSPQGLTFTEIAARLEVSPSEIFRIIVVMEQQGWLRKSGRDKYTVTPKLLSLAFRATPAEDLAVHALPHMRELSLLTDQSCHLVVQEREKGLVVARVQNAGPVGIHVRLGAEVDLKTSCSGHVLLAFGLPSIALDAIPPAERPFAASLNAVRHRGYEMLESGFALGVTDISYPIFDICGYVVAAITIPFLRRIDGVPFKSFDDTQNLLKETATKISEELGFAPALARHLVES